MSGAEEGEAQAEYASRSAAKNAYAAMHKDA
jgi:hypothetical protein